MVEHEKFLETILNYRKYAREYDKLKEQIKSNNDDDGGLQKMLAKLKVKRRIWKDRVAKKFIKVADHWINTGSYRQYYGSRRDDMISLAIDYMYRNIDKYDTDIGKPFTYFSMPTVQAFLQQIKKYQREDMILCTLPDTENYDEDNDVDYRKNENVIYPNYESVSREYLDNYKAKMRYLIENDLPVDYFTDEEWESNDNLHLLKKRKHDER